MQFPVKSKDAPIYMQYIGVCNYYRVGGNYIECVKSLFYLHTETFNVWSVIISFMFSLFSSIRSSYLIHDSWPAFLLFFFASLIHSPASLCLHLFMTISVETFRYWRKMDMLGIFTGSVCFTFALSYYVFPWWGIFFNTMTTFSLAVTALRKLINIPDHVPLHDPSLTIYTFSVIIAYWIPMAFILCYDGMPLSIASMCAILELLFLSFAALSFASNWPQKRFPGKFDLIGNSHHIMRLCVMTAHINKFCFIVDSATRNIKIDEGAS